MMIFVAPQSRRELVLNKGMLVSVDGKETYSVIKDVPILLPEKTNPDWNRELLEIIFWEHPEEIINIYSEIENKNYADFNEVCVRHIKALFSTKDKLIEAFDSYKQRETNCWIAGDRSGIITQSKLDDFTEYSKKSTGRKRTETIIKGKGGYWEKLRYFGELVCKEKSGRILELATGAGGGTASVALCMPKECELYTVDIDFSCLGNAFGIGKYQEKIIVPVCANFWYLPFRDSTFKTVCTVFGLDESREITETLKEISRVLSAGGRFVVISRNDAFMRHHHILEPFGFTESETVEILKSCRMFSDIKALDEICDSLGMALLSREEFKGSGNAAFSISEYGKQSVSLKN